MVIGVFSKIFFLAFVSIIVAKRTYTTLPPYGRCYVRHFKCQMSQKALQELIYPNYTCYAKSYSRAISTFNGYALLRRPVNSFFLSAVLEYRYGTIYREVIKVPLHNPCYIIERIDDKSTNLVTHHAYKIFKETVPFLVHSCPYTIVEAYNISFPTEKLPSVFPQGDYRTTISISLERNGEIYVNITVLTTAFSSFRDSFG